MKRFFLLMAITVAVSLKLHSQTIDAIVAGIADDHKKADTLFSCSIKYMMRAKDDSAMLMLEKALPFVIKTGKPELMARYYTDMSNVIFTQSAISATLSVLDKAAPYISNTTPYNIHSKYLLIKAKCYRRMDQHDSALHYYRLCENLNNQYNSYRNWLVYLEVANMFDEADDYVEAEKYFMKTYSLTKERAVRMDYGVVIHLLADFFYKWKAVEKFAAILKEYQAFVDAAKKDYTKDPVHSVLINDWGDTPLNKKVEFMQNVKQSLLNSGDFTNGSYANSTIASFYENDNKPGEALKYVQENIRISTEHPHLSNLYIYTKASYRLLKKLGRNDEAIAAADRIFLLKDSIIKTQQRAAVLDLESKYQAEKKEKEIALLNSKNELNALQLLREVEIGRALQRENDLKDSRLQKEQLLRQALQTAKNLSDSNFISQQLLTISAERENSLQEEQLGNEKKLNILLAAENDMKQKKIKDDQVRKWMLLSGATVFALLGCIIFFQYRRQIRKNGIIKKQTEELEILNREIHHRVKNNLQVISSLLDLQSQTIDDEKIAEKFQEGSHRVQSMAFIHQNLYQGENINSINIREYINMLTSNLMQSYNTDSDRIKLTASVEQLNLHSDTVIPLGMIINELVSNSLKYAFGKQPSGQINVVLKKVEEKLLLQVKDNGPGIQQDTDVTRANSFGYKIIKAFAQKLKATLTISNSDGADIQLLISKYRTV